MSTTFVLAAFLLGSAAIVSLCWLAFLRVEGLSDLQRNTAARAALARAWMRLSEPVDEPDGATDRFPARARRPGGEGSI